MPHREILKRPDWSLTYEKYDAAELRSFIEARTGATLSQKERRTIRNCNRFQLAKRLRKIDQASTFPRFMELPPELRLNVYELLLVDAREKDEDGLVKDREDVPDDFRLHPAVLRTSKQIYSEAQPVLYKKNTFSARMVYSVTTPKWSGPIIGCSCIIVRPGKTSSCFQKTFTSPYSLSLSSLFQHPAMGMLRSLTHLTINLSLATPGFRDSDEYVPRARNAIACLCLSLLGASKMKKLTINVSAEPKILRRSRLDFARILWPLVFLRTDIVVKFEGIAEILKTTKPYPKTGPHAEGFYGGHIAKIRQRCNEEISKQSSDLVSLRGVEAALASMSFFGDEFVSMDDIVNLSAAWTGMRSEADRLEATGLKKESLL
jgi:hypothetical protein